MHLTIGKTVFLKELNILQGVVEKKSTIPILSNLLLEAIGEELWIKGTDLDVSISTRCESEIKQEGAICVQAKKLFEIIRSLPEAEIEIKCGGNDQVSLVCERSRFKMLGLPRDNFPEIKSFDGTSWPIPSDLMRTFISRTIFAITTEESRYALNGAKFELSEKGIRMVATDGHRLSFIEKQSNFGDGRLDVLIPKKTLAELSRLCMETSEDVEVGNADNHLFFRVGKRLLVSRTLTGQFPNYELVLPKENNNRVVIENSRVAAAIRRVALMADDRSHAIKFNVCDGQINITSQSSEMGEAVESLPVEYAGPSITAGFNAQYLLDFFNVVQDGDVVFEFKDGNSQTQIKSNNNSDYDLRYIVMPMRL
ncbi:MAG: DNA polymerase III subunit beta [Acidobacteria bacterium]|nr:DNA polymerase III subunit beta [Acidobacteriota bacterium]